VRPCTPGLAGDGKFCVGFVDRLIASLGMHVAPHSQPMAIALLLAAGSGERLGANVPKAFVELAGKTLLQWSLDVLARIETIEQIVLAVPPNTTAVPDTVELPSQAICVQGGAVRSASVHQALAAAGPGDPVLIHDAARPLLTRELVERTLDALTHKDAEAAIAATPVADTIKRAAGDPPQVTETLDRAGLWAVQTPQVFRRVVLERALDVSAEVLAQATDDAWLVEHTGGRVVIVKSGAANLKVTTPTDLHIAETLIAARNSCGGR
jgi:2-C-methyl-D-erythritol 4-phosphate cytidylyltransferase